MGAPRAQRFGVFFCIQLPSPRVPLSNPAASPVRGAFHSQSIQWVVMADRLEVLQRIADLALRVRSLERELIPATDTRKVIDLLKAARAELDEALEDRARLERDG